MGHNDVLCMYEQGLNRLKRVLNEGSSGRSLDCSRTSDASNKYSHPVKRKVDGESYLNDRFGRGNSSPFPVRYKKFGNEEVSRQRDHQRKERLQQTMRERPPIEIGPKRLKVRGPSFFNLESRSN